LSAEKKNFVSLAFPLFFPAAPSLYFPSQLTTPLLLVERKRICFSPLLPQLSAQLFNFSSILEKKRTPPVEWMTNTHRRESLLFAGVISGAFVLRRDLAWKTFVLTLDLPF
jgi:hypothetical protein